jgi:hypothetical protein
MVADKQTDTKAPPSEAKKPGADATASQTLHGHVQEIQANGNVKPSAADAAKGTAQAEQHFGKVEIVDHNKPGNAPKPEPAHESGFMGWYHSTVASAEHMGEAAMQKGANAIHNVGNELHDAKTYVGNKIDQAGHNIAEAGHEIHQAEQKVVNKVSEIAHSDTVHNLEDVVKTMGQGTYEAGAKMVHSIEHAPAAAVNGIKDAAVWAEHHPGEAVAIAAGALAVGTAVVLTGGVALAGVGAASAFLTSGAAATVLEGAGIAAAVGGSAVAVIDVAKHGEISTLMNQQHEKPEDVARAREQLKKDTGGAILGDLMLGGGAALKYGFKEFAAMRAGATAEAATTAVAGETASAARAGEAVGAVPHPIEAPVPGDNPLLTHTENVVEHIAEEVTNATSATVSSASAIAGVLDKCRVIAGTAYQHYNDANNLGGVVKSGFGLFGRLKGYGVASPQKHDVAPQPANSGSGVPDEPTRH